MVYHFTSPFFKLCLLTSCILAEIVIFSVLLNYSYCHSSSDYTKPRQQKPLFIRLHRPTLFHSTTHFPKAPHPSTVMFNIRATTNLGNTHSIHSTTLDNSFFVNYFLSNTTLNNIKNNISMLEFLAINFHHIIFLV